MDIIGERNLSNLHNDANCIVRSDTVKPISHLVRTYQEVGTEENGW